MATQPALWSEPESYPAGWHVLRGWANPQQQREMYVHAQELGRVAPFVTPRMRGGQEFKVQLSSWGCAGWHSDALGYSYLKKHPVTGRPWPAIPGAVRRLLEGAAREAGYLLKLQTVLVNYYHADNGSLGAHQDRSEEDWTSPIVTLSLGDSCVFGMGNTRGQRPMQWVELHSGDVVVMGGPARLAYHEVKKLYPHSSSLLRKGGRLSFTGRKVY
jgi:alkylated DNA repair protein (DNA oxidative demethylase)